MKGKLYLIPVPTGGSDPGDVIPENVINITLNTRYFIVENLRTARRYLRSVSRDFPIDDCIFYETDDFASDIEMEEFLKPAIDGNNIGLVSESGMPCILDPGEKIVLKAHSLGINVVPLTGPTSLMLALAASGLNGENFRVHGYLPVKAQELRSKIVEIERGSLAGEAQVFIEVPFRNQRMLSFLLETCRPDTYLCIASDLTMTTEEISTRRIREWRLNIPQINKRQVVFVLQASR